MQHYICQVAASSISTKQQHQQQPQTSAPAPAAVSYSVPFPMEPYSVQRGVAAAIRAACSIGNGTVCVVESPTGTGKSQALINGVLSHVASERKPRSSKEVEAVPKLLKVAEEQNDDDDESAAAGQRRSRETQEESKPAAPAVATFMKSQHRQQQEGKRNDDGDDDDSSDDSSTADESNNAQALLDRVNSFIHQQDALSRQLKTMNSRILAAKDGDDDFAFLVNVTDDGGDDDSSKRRRFSEFDTTSSSASSSSSDEEDDHLESLDDADFADAFERLAVAASPKVIFTSRTHSQLSQIIDEVQKGAFRFVTVGNSVGTSSSTAAAAAENSQQQEEQQQQQQQPAAGAPFPIRFLHLGSRQQLCINDEIRAQASRAGGGGGERLNELCKEATVAYRNSAEAKLSGPGTSNIKNSKPKKQSAAARTLQAQRQLSMKVNTVLHGKSGDLEDLLAAQDDVNNNNLNEGCGCRFADQSRIQQLLRYMMIAPRSMQQIKELGRRLGACPFYASRYAVHFSQLILMPYANLVDERARAQVLDGGLRMEEGAGGEVHRHGGGGKKQKKMEKLQESSAAGDIKKVAAKSLPWQLLVARSLMEHQREKKSQQQQQQHQVAESSSDTILQDSILVIDEGHNLAESAAAACTATLRADSIESAIRTIDAYSQHFDSRLLATTKQRLRELRALLIAWLRFLVQFQPKTAASGDDQQQKQQQQQQETVLATFTLTGFLFETDTAHVNLFTFVEFLEQNNALTRIGFFAERHFALAHQKLLLSSGGSGGEQNQNQQQSTAAAAKQQRQELNDFNKLSKAQQQERKQQIVAEMREQEQRQRNVASHVAGFVSPIKALREVHRAAELLAKSPEHGTVVAVLEENDSASASALGDTKKKHRSLQILGLSPAQAVEPLTLGAHATILAGGTLQPFQLLRTELFPSYAAPCSAAQALAVHNSRALVSAAATATSAATTPATSSSPSLPTLIVEAFSHVVDPQRFLVFPVTAVPLTAQPQSLLQKVRFTRATLDERPKMFQGVCSALLQLCRIVPRGLVVFLPSFALEEAFFNTLNSAALSSTRQQIESVKKIFREGDTITVASATSDPKTHRRVLLKGEDLFAEYAKHIDRCKRDFPSDKMRGALLVSVMGGRLSEGINFSDDLGRCVVVVGMPYPNLGDPKLQLKLQSLKGAAAAGTRTTATSTASASSSSAVGGEDWSKRYYDALCMRSVNQSVGRCIRHIKDYAVVVLLDERYNETKVARQLPAWMQPRLMMNGSFATVTKTVSEFFAQR